MINGGYRLHQKDSKLQMCLEALVRRSKLARWKVASGNGGHSQFRVSEYVALGQNWVPPHQNLPVSKTDMFFFGSTSHKLTSIYIAYSHVASNFSGSFCHAALAFKT